MPQATSLEEGLRSVEFLVFNETNKQTNNSTPISVARLPSTSTSRSLLQTLVTLCKKPISGRLLPSSVHLENSRDASGRAAGLKIPRNLCTQDLPNT